MKPDLERLDRIMEYLDALATVESLPPNQSVEPFDDCKAFGVFWAIQEYKELGALEHIATDVEIIEALAERMNHYALARSEYHVYRARKECADSTHPVEEIANAAVAGLAFHKRQVDEDLVKAFLERIKEVSEPALTTFQKWSYKPLKERWSHRDLDSWLICVWPIVDSYQWTYSELLKVVEKRFPQEVGYPFDDELDLAKHCRKTLGLSVSNKAGEKKSKLYEKLPMPELWSLAIRIQV